MPPADVLPQITRAFDALGNEILALRVQIASLAQTRDLLLPRLVTGRLDISDIDLGDLLPEKEAA